MIFTTCGNSTDGFQNVTFSSNVVGNYAITHTWSDSGLGTYTNSANFTLYVEALADANAPAVTLTVPPVTGSNGWFKTNPVTLQVAASDTNPVASLACTIEGSPVSFSSISGLNSSSVSASFNVTLEGISNVSCSATDASNNQSNAATAVIYIDSVAPAISAAVSPALPTSGWYNLASGAPTVTYTCTDGNSGVSSCTPDYTFGEGADQTHTGTAVDVAGNIASASVSDIDVDLTAPTIIAAVSPDRPASGWWNLASGAPTVTYTCTDDTGSGVASCTTPNTFGEGADQTHTGTAVDNAGNSASEDVSDIDVDLTAPTITWNGGPADGATYNINVAPVPAAPTCTAIDALSGENGCAVSGYSTALGAHTMTATAYDHAGNSSQETRSYTVTSYTFSGFYQPVDMGSVLNTVKNGSTVPLKFELFDGATELTDVTLLTMSAMKVNCLTNVVEDAYTLVTSGSTSLRYDTTEGKFIFNWKTPKTVGICYAVSANAGGVNITANFKLK